MSRFTPRRAEPSSLASSAMSAKAAFGFTARLHSWSAPMARFGYRTRPSTSSAARPKQPRTRRDSEIGVEKHTDQHRPKCPVLLAVDQEFGEGASRTQVAEACREQLQPSSLSGFRTGESGAYGGGGGRMIAAISIGIVIIIAVIVAALAIIYFVLKGSPR